MSMENAILVHAAAMEKLAAAIGAAYGGGVALMATRVESTAGADLVEEKAAELATATDKRAAAARDAKARDAKALDAKQNAAEVKPDADLEQAVAKVEDDATQSAGRKAITDALAAAKAGMKGADDDGLDTPLDYAKDVRPVLLAAIKKAGKDKVQALISTFGVDKADKVDAAKFGELLAGAQKLAA